MCVCVISLASGPSRNLCAHGVLVTVPALPTATSRKEDHGSATPLLPPPQSVPAATAPRRVKRRIASDRISLNLRFGVHSALQAHESIDKHWR